MGRLRSHASTPTRSRPATARPTATTPSRTGARGDADTLGLCLHGRVRGRPTAPVSSAVHIAILDDDAEITRLLSGYLQNQGYRVSETHAGPALLRLMAADPPDLVLLD